MPEPQDPLLRDVYVYCYARTQQISDNDATYLLRRLGVGTGRDSKAGNEALKDEAAKVANSSVDCIRLRDSLSLDDPLDLADDDPGPYSAAHLLASDEFYGQLLRNVAKKAADEHCSSGEIEDGVSETRVRLGEKIEEHASERGIDGAKEPVCAAGCEEKTEALERAWLITTMKHECKLLANGKLVNLRTLIGSKHSSKHNSKRVYAEDRCADDKTLSTAFDGHAKRTYQAEQGEEALEATMGQIWELIGRLPHIQCKVLTGRYLDGKTIREVAQELKLTEGQVQHISSAGIDKLRDEMREAGYAIP